MGEIEEDMLGVLLCLQDNGELEFPIITDDIRAFISDVFTAETETSLTATDWAMSEMMRKPSVMQKVQAKDRRVLSTSNGTRDETRLPKLRYLKLVFKKAKTTHFSSTPNSRRK